MDNDLTDEQILESACVSTGCVNFSQSGRRYCRQCVYGHETRMPKDMAKRKLALEKQGKTQWNI